MDPDAEVLVHALTTRAWRRAERLGPLLLGEIQNGVSAFVGAAWARAGGEAGRAARPPVKAVSAA